MILSWPCESVRSDELQIGTLSGKGATVEQVRRSPGGGGEDEESDGPASARPRVSELNALLVNPSSQDPRNAFPRKGAYYQRTGDKPRIREGEDPRKHLRAPAGSPFPLVTETHLPKDAAAAAGFNLTRCPKEIKAFWISQIQELRKNEFACAKPASGVIVRQRLAGKCAAGRTSLSWRER